MEESKNPNCIIKAFENYDITIFQEVVDKKKQFYFKASDVANVLGLTNIRVTIQNFSEKEKVVMKAYTPGGEQNVLFLTSRGVYRILYISKKKEAAAFRDWVGDILDDIIFNESNELKKKLLEKENLLIEQNKLIKEKEEELKKKEDQLNWLHIVTKKDVKFYKRYDKEDSSLYMGCHEIEGRNYIVKVGKSSNSSVRKNTHSTSTADRNRFNTEKVYSTYPDLAIPVEHFIHALLSPLSASINKSRKELFMAHTPILNNIITNVLNNVDLCVEEINNYIVLLEQNKFNFDVVSNLLENEEQHSNILMNEISNISSEENNNIDEDILEESDTKTNEDIITQDPNTTYSTCKECNETKTLVNFEFLRKEIRRVKCISCRNKDSIKCNRCGEYKLGINYPVNDKCKRQQQCIECVPSTIRHKKCQKCIQTKTTDQFDFSPTGGRYRYCIDCRITYKKCMHCFEKKSSREYSLTPKNETKKYCDTCYKIVEVKSLYKKCLKCEESVLKSNFCKRKDGKRNRVCDHCRNINTEEIDDSYESDNELHTSMI